MTTSILPLDPQIRLLGKVSMTLSCALLRSRISFCLMVQESLDEVMMFMRFLRVELSTLGTDSLTQVMSWLLPPIFLAVACSVKILRRLSRSYLATWVVCLIFLNMLSNSFWLSCCLAVIWLRSLISLLLMLMALMAQMMIIRNPQATSPIPIFIQSFMSFSFVLGFGCFYRGCVFGAMCCRMLIVSGLFGEV